MEPSRRELMLGLGAAAAWPASISRALALPAGGRSGTIRDAKHVVILIQENRAFDHYFAPCEGCAASAIPWRCGCGTARACFTSRTSQAARYCPSGSTRTPPRRR